MQQTEKKKGGFGKVVLMLLAMALVAVISVYIVRAYLSSKSAEEPSSFYGAGDLLGEIVETGKISPNNDEMEETPYNASYGGNFRPGVTVGTLPRVDNDSENEMEMYAGVRLDFYIYCHNETQTSPTTAGGSTAAADTEGRYVKVSYEQFKAFVTLEGFTPTEITSASTFDKTADDDIAFTWANYGTSSLGWYQYDYDLPSGNQAVYLFFNKKLRKDWDSIHYSGYVRDHSTPIFSGVTVKPGLMINARNEDVTTVTSTTVSDELTTTYRKTTTQARAYNFMESDITRYGEHDLDVLDETSWSKLAENSESLKVYNDFKFKILITGYGVNVETMLRNATDEKSANQLAFEQVYEGLKGLEITQPTW